MKSSRKINIRWTLVFYDSIVYLIIASIFLFYYRGGGILEPAESLKHLILCYACVFGARTLFGIYRLIWRYGGVQCYLRLMVADGAGAVFYFIINWFPYIHRIATARILSVCAINLLGVLAIRMVYRYAFKCGRNTDSWGRFLNALLRTFAGRTISDQQKNSGNRINVAIVGAGRVGVSLADELANNENSPYAPVCFVDTNQLKVGRSIHGIPVISGNAVTAGVLTDYEVEEIIFAVPGLTAERKKYLYETYRSMNFPIKVYDFPIMQNAGSKRQIRSFEIEEVLFRAPIIVKDERSNAYYEGRCILVTGAGGSIGSELTRQLAAMKPARLILLDNYENGVYDVQQELRMAYGDSLDMHVEIASITNRAALTRVFETWHPDIVINAAAHKHVPLMERNCIEAIENNVFGMLNIIQLCEEYGTGRFMQLSTDKAVNPTNVMGATKRLCELIMLAYSTNGKVRCSATRFGNVLGSAGSVIPLFKKQIAAGGPVTLTDKRIIRYFMTIPEASQLVLQSGAIAANGELFVLDMGSPVRILELAENMIRLSGFVPYKDINIIETGLRPGEKLYEELLMDSETLSVTENALIFIEKDEPITMEELNEKLRIVREACATQDDNKAREALRSIVDTYRKPEEVNREAIAANLLEQAAKPEIPSDEEAENTAISSDIEPKIPDNISDIEPEIPDSISDIEPDIPDNPSGDTSEKSENLSE